MCTETFGKHSVWFSSWFLITGVLLFINLLTTRVLSKVFCLLWFFRDPSRKSLTAGRALWVQVRASAVWRKARKYCPLVPKASRGCRVQEGFLITASKIPAYLMPTKLRLVAISCFVGRLCTQQGCSSHGDQFSSSDKPSASGWVTHQRHQNWNAVSQRMLHLIQFYLLVKS